MHASQSQHNIQLFSCKMPSCLLPCHQQTPLTQQMALLTSLPACALLLCLQFGDFVDWYMGRRPSREVKEAAAKSSQ